ncbi:MAG: pyrroline-5-carboxylate reductase [Sedimentisphaerales bacterium]|nr:pyrroline-5-carboxylate reductase [Sedimentisphaerales bacterium]
MVRLTLRQLITGVNIMETIGFLGAGNMAEALIKGIITKGLYKPGSIFISDIRAERLQALSKQYNIQQVSENSRLTQKTQIIVLAVKPQNMAEALESIKETIRPGTLFISIAAGIKTANISSVLSDVAIVRVMPNTPALIGEGASALFVNAKARPMLDKAVSIFSAVGQAVLVDDEDLMDAVTAVSGSGPAYYFLLMEKMVDAAVEMGIDKITAEKLVLQTAKGAALLALEADAHGENPAQLRQKVTSPGGTTQAALQVLKDGKFSSLITEAIQRASSRSRELSA